jgi:hypothetical protein
MLRILTTLAILLMPPPSSYIVGDVEVFVSTSCGNEAVLTREIVALRATSGPTRYRIADLDAWPVVSVLGAGPGAGPGAVTRDGDVVTWQAHAAGASFWVIVGGLAECPTAEALVTPLYDARLPLVLR